MSIRRTIKAELYRLGLQARPKQVVAALREKGIHVGLDLVKQVKIELLKETSPDIDKHRIRNQVMSRRPQKIPQKRPQRRSAIKLA